MIKNKTLEVIKSLLEEELVVAGDLLPDNAFKVWNIKIDNIIEKIKIEWNNLDSELNMYELVWFDITEKGRKEFEYLNSLPVLENDDPFYYDDE